MSPNFVKLIVPINIKSIRDIIGIELVSSMPIEDGLSYASKADFRFVDMRIGNVTNKRYLTNLQVIDFCKFMVAEEGLEPPTIVLLFRDFYLKYTIKSIT